MSLSFIFIHWPCRTTCG